MDEEETKNCPNCKREIPAVNFTIHSVHCARNIRVCPVCKEPVPGAELDDHHNKFHKLLPCKQCGESVCGTDLEDHIRDSCANTIKTCRFCDLELPRRELPAHEGYCGVRTEQCPECNEWVMIKYKQLHVDSNHGFIRLDDDPPPPKKDPPKINIRPVMSASQPKIRPAGARPYLLPTSVGPTADSSGPTSYNNLRLNSVANARQIIGSVAVANSVEDSGPTPNPAPSNAPSRPNYIVNDAGPRNFSNDLPRTQMRHLGSSSTGSSGSSSTVSPQEGSTSANRPVNGVKKRTNDQPQINTNKEVANKVDKDLAISRGAVKKRPAPKPPRATPADPRRDMAYYSALQRQQREEKERREQNEYNLAHGLPPVLSPAAKIEKLRKMDALQNRDAAQEYWNSQRKSSSEVRDEERRRQEFKNLKPMSPEQFMARFNELQLRGEEVAVGDRFSEIKSSLRELRRGLNEVTAPYNNNNINANNNDRVRTPSPREEVRLPCEFCDVLVAADDLVQHQTGCRPDLAQYRAACGGPSPRRAAPVVPAAAAPGDPLIPCEFCAEPVPVYLIAEHQERCAREDELILED